MYQNLQRIPQSTYKLIALTKKEEEGGGGGGGGIASRLNACRDSIFLFRFSWVSVVLHLNRWQVIGGETSHLLLPFAKDDRMLEEPHTLNKTQTRY